MAVISYNDDVLNVSGANDSIVIIRDLADVPAGVVLDVSGLDSSVEYIAAGHIIIQNETTKTYKPLGVTGGAYASLDAGYRYAGVLKATISVKKPHGAITTIGQVNAQACPYAITDTIKSGLPHIDFIYNGSGAASSSSSGD